MSTTIANAATTVAVTAVNVVNNDVDSNSKVSGYCSDDFENNGKLL